MTLPFTRDAFFDLFGQYNAAHWLAAIALWVLVAAAALYLARRDDEAHTLVVPTLVVLWAWGGIAYHASLFARINPAAPLFAVLFVIESGVLAWYGAERGGIRFTQSAPLRHAIGLSLVIYALLYPAIVFADGGEYPRMPTFGVPCPTTIATAGFLIAADRPLPFATTLVPIVWAIVGGSAAFLLGVPADLVLLAAGVLLAVDQVVQARVGFRYGRSIR